MDKKDKKQKSIKSEEGLRIDYENIDVADIMDQIKQKIAERPRSSRQEIGKEDHRYYVPSAHISADSTEIHGAKGKARGLLLKIMRRCRRSGSREAPFRRESGSRPRPRYGRCLSGRHNRSGSVRRSRT